MLNELLIKELSSHVETNTSDIQEIKDAEVYSTSEVKTNKIWINGKPIYRKSYHIPSFPNSDTFSIDLEINSLDSIIDVFGFAKSKTNNYAGFPINNTRLDNPGAPICVYFDNTMKINTGQDRSNYTGYITLEYTKTTD